MSMNHRRLVRRFATPFALLALVFVLTRSWAASTDPLDQLKLLTDVRYDLVAGYVTEPDQQKMVQAAIRGMIESLGDPYTAYLDPEDLEGFDRTVRGSFSGIGAEVDLLDGRLHIVTPLEDSPAWRAGVMAGDIVLEIDGQSTEAMELSDCIKLLIGEPGTEVTILVRHESGEEQSITMTRAVINVQTVRGFRRNAEHHYDFMLDPVHRVGYVRLTQFSEKTAQELRAALQELTKQNVQALVIDLRYDPGGLLQAAIEVSDMFLPEGKTIVSVEGRSVPRQVYSSTDDTLMPSLPVVVLANEASASAAEIVTGALSDNDRALFVGTRTFGKGSVQQVKMLESQQGAIKMTNAYYYIPSGRLIHRRDDSEVWGVDPSEGCYVPMSPQQQQEMIEVRRDTDTIRRSNGSSDAQSPVTPQWIDETLKDPQLAAALRAALGKIETGAWPAVGESNTEELVKASKRATLVMRRDLLRDRLDEVQRELTALDTGEELDSSADESTSSADQP